LVSNLFEKSVSRRLNTTNLFTPPNWSKV